MTGLNDTDIRLNSEWQLTQATDGDAPLCSGLECLYQNIVLEALTQPGDVFYDAEFGWGLYDFIQSEDTELTRLEITQRVRLKLQKREVILPESIEISIAFEDDAVVLHCSFRFAEEDERHELDVIILGRRRADGNYVGRNSNIYTDGKGVTRFSPLAAWKHEHILAYIHYHQLPLPPIYGWKNGYLCGTHPWPARQWTGSIENGWHEVYDIDPGIVLAAAEKIDSARAFLKGVQA